MQAFQTPAAGASTAMLVPAGFLPRAAGLNQTLLALMTVAAAPLGAIAISVMPLGWALGLDVATAVFGIVPLLIYRIPQPVTSLVGKTSLWGEFSEGVQLVWRDPGMRRLYGLLGGVVLVIMPSATLVPLLVKQHFGGGVADVALMESVGGVGMLAGGIAMAAFAPRPQMRWILWGFAVSCFSLAFAGLMPGHLFWLALIWWAVSGITFVMADAPLTALLQTTVPHHLQGRVLSLLGTVMGLAAPVGLAIATPLGELIGVRWLFVVMGLAGGCVSIVGFLSRPLLKMDSPRQ
jgi:DHA3 family macrolide efflux protein-like MFS transporter